STGADVLKLLVQRPELKPEVKEVLHSLLKFALLDKDVGTYYYREVRGADGSLKKVSGMLQYLTDEDIVHHGLNTTATATTRLSSNRPNAQNFSRGDKNEYHVSEVKENFTSRFGEDGYIVEADYGALEVVTLACLTQDSVLRKALLDGTD